MAKYKLTDESANRYLEVEYQTKKGKTKTKRVPLADSLTLEDSMSFVRANNTTKKQGQRDRAVFEWFYKFFCRHLGRKLVGSLTNEQIIALSRKWNEASNEVDSDAGGATMGES